jgi:hypothetical protein
MGPTALLPLRRKSCYGFLSPLRIYRPRTGLNPRTLGPVASTLPLDHRGRLTLSLSTHTYIYIYIYYRQHNLLFITIIITLALHVSASRGHHQVNLLVLNGFVTQLQYIVLLTRAMDPGVGCTVIIVPFI